MSIKEKDKKARANYRKKIVPLYIELLPQDEDIKSRLAEVTADGESKTAYIKRLIRNDIEKARD